MRSSPALDAHTLSETLIFELIKAFSLPQTEGVRRLFRLVWGRVALHFSELALGLDREVETHGAAAGARWALPNFVAGYQSQGAEQIPPEGPLIIASNHPAAFDSLVISAHIDRPDYRIIIGDIPFFKNLPHVCQHAIFSPEAKDTYGRMQTVRAAIQHLKNDGALLIFPRGGIEPDPAIMPDPASEFAHWSRSLGVFLHRVPRARILITMVSGVIAPAAMRHPITWLRKKRPDRQRLAFMYQFIRQTLAHKELFGLRPRLTFGEVLAGLEPDQVLQEVEQAAGRTLQQHLAFQSNS